MPTKDHKPLSAGIPPGVEVTLIVRKGPQPGLRYHLTRPEVRIGRRKDMDFILSDATVSAEHARLFFHEGGLWIEDLKSLNGTLVNDRRIQRSLLQDHDRITVGKYELEVQMQTPAPRPEPRPAGPAPVRLSVKLQIKEVWLAGFTPDLRRLLREVLSETLSGHATAFPDGEKVLRELSTRLDSDSGPDLIILDLRMPLISGVNTAIAIRAFEQGFVRSSKIPIAFLGQTPDPASMEKVIQFCHPASYMVSSLRADELREHAMELMEKVKSELLNQA